MDGVIVHRGEVYRTLTRDASRRMPRNRVDVFPDYDWAHFERLLRQRFTLAEVVESHGGGRKLCLLLPRA